MGNSSSKIAVPRVERIEVAEAFPKHYILHHSTIESELQETKTVGRGGMDGWSGRVSGWEVWRV
jgi:hypothetical protein